MSTQSIKQPLRKGGFTFKRFFIAHDNCPMKVTTDSALLGAWVPITPYPKTVLDIGSGCGIIALMLAQRLEQVECKIDAIDIDAMAVLQCQQNIANSPFDTITAQCVDINQYKMGQQQQYDLIVCNPPYFESAVNCRSEQRQQARYTENLTHPQLVEIVTRLLTPTGRFCLVLPYRLSASFKELCLQYGLYVEQETNMRYTADKAPSLALLGFTFDDSTPALVNELCMRRSDSSYTDEFKALLKDFYLFAKK